MFKEGRPLTINQYRRFVRCQRYSFIHSREILILRMQFLEILQILLHEILAQHVKKQCYDDDGDVDICIDINVQIARQK